MMDSAEGYAEFLYKKFGKLAPWVVAELLDFSYSGYDFDSEKEIPYFNKVKGILIDKYDLEAEEA